MPLSRVLKVLLGAISWVCFPAISHAIQVGQTEAQVIKELGEPGMKTPLGPKGVIWAYKHGDLIVKGGRVVSVSFRSPEQVATVEREERLAREKAHAERLLEDIERARAAEAQARMIALESRLQAFQQRRHAVLFGNLTLSDSSPSESGGSASAIFSYRKTEETFVETGGGSAIGDSMQSVGGGGGVGLSGRSGYVIPSVEYVVLWLTLDSAAPILDRDMVASVAFTNRISIPPVSYRVSFDQLPRRDGDGPTLRRYRADMLLAPDSLPDAVFARSDGISIKIRGLPVAGQAPTFDLVSGSEIPVAPRR